MKLHQFDTPHRSPELLQNNGITGLNAITEDDDDEVEEADTEAEDVIEVELEIDQVDCDDGSRLSSSQTQTGPLAPLLESSTNDIVSYGEEGRMAVKMIRAQLVESYLIEQLVAGILPAKIPLQTFVNRFNDWLAPPKPAPRRYHCQFSDKMFLKPMKAYENFGITKKKAQRRRQYFIDHVKFRAKLVADGKISQPLECNDASIISDNIANIDVKDGSYANELAARKEKTRKEREKRAKIVDEWLIYQLRVQKLPSEILNSQMLPAIQQVARFGEHQSPTSPLPPDIFKKNAA